MMCNFSKIVGFIEKHAIHDAERDAHPLCAEEYKELRHDLERHVEKIRMAVEGLSREGKFG